MLLYIFLAFLAYLLFKLIVDFVIPVYKTTQRVKRSFREMQQKMQGQSSHASQPQNDKVHDKKKKPSSDYIDFEEVKDWLGDFPIFAA